MTIWTISYTLILFEILTTGRVSSEYNKMPSEVHPRKSLAHYARIKIANLYSMKEQIEKYRIHPPMDELIGGSNQNNNSENISALHHLSLPILLMPKSIKNLSRNNPAVLEKVKPQVLTLFRSSNQEKNYFISKLLPKTDILKRLAKMRETLEPNLRTFLTSKYNDFLTNLIPYSDSIGVAPFMLNSMKISENFDQRWNYIQNLLETSTLEQFLNNLPEIFSLELKSYTVPGLGNLYKGIQSRSDDNFISDQEPQATSKGKKKYGTLRLPTRMKVFKKGELTVVPERYAGFDDQYSLYSQNVYDINSYGKGYDDYSVVKGGSKYTTPTADKYGEIDLQYASGHNSYSNYGSGHGHGGGGIGDSIDPFSILGGLAFLVYLGLLFQQTFNMTGRSLSDQYFINPSEKKVELTLLNFGPQLDGRSLGFRFRNRKGRANNIGENLEDAAHLVEIIWRDIQSLNYIKDIECRNQKLCLIIKNLENQNLLSFFIEVLEKQGTDKQFLYDILNQVHGRGMFFDCQLRSKCEG